MELTIAPNSEPKPPAREPLSDRVRPKVLVESAADWLHSLSSRFYSQWSDPVVISGDDEHLWIGLVP